MLTPSACRAKMPYVLSDSVPVRSTLGTRSTKIMLVIFVRSLSLLECAGPSVVIQPHSPLVPRLPFPVYMFVCMPCVCCLSHTRLLVTSARLGSSRSSPKESLALHVDKRQEIVRSPPDVASKPFHFDPSKGRRLISLCLPNALI